MFVQGNTLSDIKVYFHQKLDGKFSDREIKQILKEASFKRLSIKDEDFILSDDIKLSESDLLYFRSVVKRLLDNEPLQYIIGTTEFYGLRLKTDRRALIPRPETEELVDWVVEEFKGKQGLDIVDLCSGTGCIALALKSKFPESQVAAVEWSEDAIELLKDNVEFTALHIEVIHEDVTSDYLTGHFNPSSLDVIVSNPPYIPTSEMSQMEANVLDYEPQMALFVEDEDPMLFYSWIADHALKLLKKGGYIYFEVNEGHGYLVEDLLESKGFVNIELRKDLEGRDRMVRAIL